jgi:hypothetical protein
MKTDYQIIKTAADVRKFQTVSNGLHDGHITLAAYHNAGISFEDHSFSFDYSGKCLTLQVLVTSLAEHPTFEICFHNITEWQLRERYCSEITDFSILFLDDGMLLWADDCAGDAAVLKQGSYVIAKTIRYRKL